MHDSDPYSIGLGAETRTLEKRGGFIKSVALGRDCDSEEPECCISCGTLPELLHDSELPTSTELNGILTWGPQNGDTFIQWTAESFQFRNSGLFTYIAIFNKPLQTSVKDAFSV
jgi:hypothetical protein